MTESQREGHWSDSRMMAMGQPRTHREKPPQAEGAASAETMRKEGVNFECLRNSKIEKMPDHYPH